MDILIPQGITRSKELCIEERHLTTQGCGRLEAVSTLSIIELMENTCLELISDKIPIGFDTVSAEINVRHISPVKLGETVKCNALLKFVDGPRLFFDVSVLDSESSEVALGAMERYIVNIYQFMKSI